MIVAEGYDRRRGHADRRIPSMGPQHDSCGRLVPFVARFPLAYLQWGRNMIVAEGAVPLQVNWPLLVGLQWGRNMIVAEGGVSAVETDIDDILQWGRNMIVAEGTRYATVH